MDLVKHNKRAKRARDRLLAIQRHLQCSLHHQPNLCAEVSSERQDYKCVVIGLGGIGSGALYWVSRIIGGEGVLGLEQFSVGHHNGGSQDHSRIIRLSYHTPNYVRLARQAYSAWSDIEAESGEQLVYQTGGLDLFPPKGAIPIDTYTTAMDAEGVPYEKLTAVEIRNRWPQLDVADDVAGLFQPNGGIVAAAKCNAAHIRLAMKRGATIRENSKVVHVKKLRDGRVEVAVANPKQGRQATLKRYCAQSVIVTAGAWTNEVLVAAGCPKLPLTVTKEQVAYFATDQTAEGDVTAKLSPPALPVWIWMDDPSFYGFPVFGEPNAIKVAQDCGGAETTADGRDFAIDEANLSRVRTFVARHLLPSARLDRNIKSVKTCLYDLTPDRDFVIDHLDDTPAHLANVWLAVGAGHAFKFASLIGKILGEAVAADAAGRWPPVDLSAFSVSRTILKMKNPPKNWMT